MERVFLLICLLLAGASAFAQEIYRIGDFLENHTLYYAIEKASNEDEVDRETYILYNKNNKVVLEQDNTPLKSYLLSNLTKATPVRYKNLPEINIHNIQDFNFDGIPDIVIDDTEILDDGCYNPQKNSSVYLSVGGQFLFSSSLSSIRNEYSCYRVGGVDPNNELKTISAYSGGGVHHNVSIYRIDSLECILIAEYVENMLTIPVFIDVEGRELKNGKWEAVRLKDIYFEDDNDKNILLSFNTENKKGKILLFQQNGVLYYAFRNTKNYNYISFAHPSHPDKAQKSKFNFENNSNEYTLEFSSGAVKYIIYESADSLGIKIYANGKLSDWDADLSSKKGSLKQLVDKQLQNLTKQ